MWGAALTQNTDFKCNNDICFGIGPVHDQYKLFQQTLNRLASLGGGFAPLVVDGFIGDLTVKAANEVAKLASLSSPGLTHEAVAANAADFMTQLADFIDTLVTVGVIAPISDAEAAKAATPDADLTIKHEALHATGVIDKSTTSPEIDGVVQQVVAACRTSRSSATCTRAKAMCKTVKGTTDGQLAEIKEICGATSTPLWVFLLAGGLGVGAIVGIGVLHHRRRRTAEATAFGADRHRPSRKYKRLR